MSHRIDIELTSNNGDTWTWRAAGARQPKGALEATLLYPGARVGDVVRAEAERELDGVRIVSVTIPKSAKSGPDLIEIIVPEVRGGVSVQYAEKAGGRGREGARGPRREGGREGGRDERGPRRERSARPDGSAPREPRSATAPRDRGPRPDRPDRPARDGRSSRPALDKSKRLNPSRVHRDALLSDLAPEHRPIAEQLFRGGIPAVRQAIIDQNVQLKAAGQPEVPAASLLSMADDLLPRVRTADWLDRAAAALDASGDISLRDLRAVVTQADQAARDDASREMGAKLRAALAGRVEGERSTWANDIVAALDDGKVVRALRLSSRLPDPNAKLAPEVTAKVVSATNAALNPQTRPDVWAAMIEAAADSPFRRDIVPVGLPDKPGESLLATAANASNRIPALLKLLGLSIPPPPRSKAVPPAPPLRPAAVAPALASSPAEAAPAAVSGEAAPAAVPAEAAPVVEAPVVEAPVVEAPVVEAPVVEASHVGSVAESVDAPITQH